MHFLVFYTAVHISPPEGTAEKIKVRGKFLEWEFFFLSYNEDKAIPVRIGMLSSSLVFNSGDIWSAGGTHHLTSEKTDAHV